MQSAFNNYKPIIFSCASDEKEIEQITTQNQVEKFDTLFEQLKEFIKTCNPSQKFADAILKQKAEAYIHPFTMNNYGMWIYYPWSKRLVRTLPEAEFIKVRTSRNQYKITPEEQLILQKKKIGIIGLSVGQSVAVTIAMERISNHIHLADFDTLELNNLNRIRTGIHNIGLPKVYSVAREIAEIDPYINITCYPEGITENNLEAFFYNGGKMDLLIEESDGFDIKIISRYAARKHGIPVLMEASDKCMVDVERFDLEPERPILHGLVEHLNIEKLKQLKTTEDKIPYMMDVLGIDTSSVRLKASMIEIEQSINTWPQLASAVTMGGGITADVARRVLLGQFNSSGRYYVDVENIIGNQPETKPDNAFKKHPTFKLEDAINFALNYQIKGKDVIGNRIESWLQFAIKAPSAGNNQPWHWVFKNDVLFVIHNATLSYCWSDTDGNLAHLALGAAIENISLTAGMDGYAVEIKHLSHPFCLAALTFSKTKESGNSILFNAIKVRCTNRKHGNGHPINATITTNLDIVAKPATIRWKHDKDSIFALADIVASVEKIRFLNPYGHDEFFNKEIRWDTVQAKKTCDGLDIATLELSQIDFTGLKVASDPAVIEKVSEWKGGDALKKITSNAIKSASAIALLSVDKNLNVLDAGACVQRFWLAAIAQGLHLQPISAPVFYFNKLQGIHHFSENEIAELNKQQIKFEHIFESLPALRDTFLFRVMYAQTPTTIALRKPLENSFTMI